MGHFGFDACLRGWELEFMVEDVNLYGVLARAKSPAAGLRQATGDVRHAARVTATSSTRTASRTSCAPCCAPTASRGRCWRYS